MDPIPATDPAPIDFALLPSQGVEIPDDHARLRSFREHERITPIRFAGEPSWMVTRPADVLALLEDETRFSSRALHEANSFPVMGRNPMGMEGEEHRLHKALVAPPFHSGLVATRYVEPILHPLGHEFVDRFLAPLLAERRRRPGDELLSMLAHAEVAGARLSDELALSFVRVIFAAGTDTTDHAVGSLIHTLLTHPETLERVRRDPALLPQTVEEGLRWNGPIGVLPRIPPADGEFLGRKLPAGSTILAGVSAATRDPAVFDEPDRFDIDRRDESPLAFGYGQRFCLGPHLARAAQRSAGSRASAASAANSSATSRDALARRPLRQRR